MFNSVDANEDGHIQLEEWQIFWRSIKAAGYSEEEIEEELDIIMNKGEWRKWSNIPKK